MSGPVRILFFLNSTVRAGVEEVVLSLVRNLDRRLFEVHLAAPQALLDAFGPELDGVSVHVFPIHLVSFRQWRLAAALVSYLRGRRIQIVNPHLFYAALFAAPLARLAGVKAVVETTHGPESWRQSWWKRSFWVDRWIETMVTLNIAVSEANRDYLVQSKRYPARKVHVVPNGRDIERYGRAPSPQVLQSMRSHWGIPDDARTLAVVGRLEQQKGHLYLIKALPSLTAKYPGLRVLLVGEGSLQQELERLAESLQVARHLIFTGFQADVVPFYHLAELVVLPSLYEGMPLVAIEAGAVGRALIASSVDGTREVVVDGETGLLVPPGSPERLSLAIDQFLSQPEYSLRLGSAAKSRIQKMFSLPRQIEETSRLYRKSLGLD